jgi:hypothetical protein
MSRLLWRSDRALPTDARSWTAAFERRCGLLNNHRKFRWSNSDELSEVDCGELHQRNPHVPFIATLGYSRFSYVERAAFAELERRGKKHNSDQRRRDFRVLKRLNVVKLAVINVHGAVRRLFQDVVEGRVPSYILAGVFAPSHQCLARVFVSATQA